MEHTKSKAQQKILDNSGQSLLEFILLLTSIMVVSLVFLRLVNTNIGNYWQAMGTFLLEDRAQVIRLR